MDKLPPVRPAARRRVTVRDIAAATGVHFTTVSLALRNSPLLNPRTRDRLQAAAKKMGYVPDPMLNALTVYRQSSRTPRFQAVIAWINNWPDRDALLRNRTFRSYYDGVCERARQLGYLVQDIWLREAGMTPDKLRSMLKAQGIQGMLLAPQPFSNTNLDMDFSGFSAVCFGYSMQPSLLHVVTNHHYHTINLAFSQVVEMGYRRIGMCVDVDWDEKVDNSFMAGWWISSQKYAARAVALPPYRGQFDNLPQLGAWMREHRPDVVIAIATAKESFERLGYSIPGDLGFAALDQNRPDVPLSGINQNSVLIGQKAVDVLIGMIHRDERGVPETPIRTLVESGWVAGETLRRQEGADQPVVRIHCLANP